MQRFDLIVIGSGSGLDVAWAASQAGWSTAVVERGPLGGTCLNCGCIPSKMLIHSADVVGVIKDAPRSGVRVEGYSVDFQSIVERTERLVDGESRRIEKALLEGDNPKLFKGTGRFVGEKTVQVGGEVIRAEKVLIATGTRPKIPEVRGLKEAGFITSTEALRLKAQPKVLTIIGGGYIAAELAHFFGTLGTEINIVQRGRLLIPNEDREVAEAFTDIWRGRYNLYTDSEPVEVARQGGTYRVTIRSSRGRDERVLESDQLLVAVGRIPNSDTLDLPMTGVKTDPRGYIITDEYLETNVKGIYALGDAVGRYPFKHVANWEADYAFNNIVFPDNRRPVDYRAMPHAIFTSPQVAGVGKTEQQLRSEGADYYVGRWRYANTAMGEAIGDETGFVKFLFDAKTGKLFGCHIMGTGASELIHEAIVAMKSGEGTIYNIYNSVYVHPALPEVVKRAALHVHGHEGGHRDP